MSSAATKSKVASSDASSAACERRRSEAASGCDAASSPVEAAEVRERERACGGSDINTIRQSVKQFTRR